MNSATGTTATTGTLTYAGTGIHDIAGNPLAGTTKTAVDKANPIITGAEILDNDSNGKVDRMKVYWSEPITSASDISAWTINNPLAGVTVQSVSTSGNTATIILTEPITSNTSTGSMSLDFTANANWKDGAVPANIASSKTNISLIDRASPAITQIRTFDNNGMYAIDLTLSEGVTGSLSGFTLSGSSTYTGIILQPTTNTLRLITADPATTDTARAYSLSYNGSGIYLKDMSNNYLANLSNGNVTDAIAPKILTRTTLDTNGNGKIDGVRFGFSESLS